MEIDPRGFVVTDETCRTTLAGVFAAGDVAGPPLLAHWAYHQGMIAAENAVTGSQPRLRPQHRPQLRVQLPRGRLVRAHRGPRPRPRASTHEVAHVRFNGNSKAVCDGDADGFVRIVCEPGGGRVLGASLDRTARHRARARARAGGPRGLTLADVAAHHPRPPDAVRGGGGGRAGRRRARHAQPLSQPGAPADTPHGRLDAAAARLCAPGPQAVLAQAARRRRRGSTAPPAPCSTSSSCTPCAARRAAPTRASASPPARRPS